MAVNEELFLIGQLEDGLLEIVRHNAFHYGVAYIRLIGNENVLAAEFIVSQHIVGEVAVIRRAFVRLLSTVVGCRRNRQNFVESIK